MKENVIPEYIQSIINSYYADNAKRLHDVVDKILLKLHFYDVDKNDFYSLANEVFMYALRDYDSTKSFDGFLYSCLYKKFCTEMTRRNRYKRGRDKILISIDAPICDGEETTIGDMIPDKFSIEKTVLEDGDEHYSQRMLIYLSRLSSLQKEILRLIMAGYLPREIQKELHINKRQYDDCSAAIRSYRNVSVLFG